MDNKALLRRSFDARYYRTQIIVSILYDAAAWRVVAVDRIEEK